MIHQSITGENAPRRGTLDNNLNKCCNIGNTKGSWPGMDTEKKCQGRAFPSASKEGVLTFRYLAGADISVQQANPWLLKEGCLDPHLNLNITSTRTEKTGHLTHWRDTTQNAMPHKEKKKRRHFKMFK